ncbi:MAG: TonB family protein [Gemmatimonadaceae bacterium]
MLTMVLESRTRLPRRRVAMVASIIGHSVLLTALVMARADGSPDAISRPVATNVVYFPPTQSQPRRAAHSRPTQADWRMRLPELPRVDLPSTAVNDAAIGEVGRIGPVVPNFATQGAPGVGEAIFGTRDRADVLTALAVDHPVEVVAGQRPPRYPSALERAGVAGDVVAQFVVDTTGRVERGSIAIRHASHADFARAVQERLLALRFVPARAQGRVVRQLVEQRFTFEVVRR